MEDLSTKSEPEEPQSFFGIIVHSFFVIPFIIAVFAVILFAGMHWLTREQLTAFDYLEQVRVGGLTKRWQAAFELTKILANPSLVPQDERFISELEAAFRNAGHDDERVRQYLALAMAKTGNPVFLKTLVAALPKANEDTLRTLIYSLGMLKDKRATPTLLLYLDHPQARIRSLTAVALGFIGDNNIAPALRNALHDSEPNVRWGAAIALARFKDASGKNILKELLNRDYLAQYKEVDPQEQTQIIIEAITASQNLNDQELNEKIRELAKNDQNMIIRSLAHAALDKTSQ